MHAKLSHEAPPIAGQRRTILLYVLTTFFDSFVFISGVSLNEAIGPSIRRINWRAHMTFPVTGGAFRTQGGCCFCFSYNRCTCAPGYLRVGSAW